jgi:solute:Na+ symporter, SSS family
VRIGRYVTIGGILVSISTALIASTYSNLMNYIQALFSIFNAPLFATFIIGMFWKRMTSAAALWGLVSGTAAALITFVGYKVGWFSFSTDLNESMVGAGLAFAVDAVVTIVVTLMTEPKPVEELQGLVYGMANEDPDAGRRHRWWESPKLLGATTLTGAAILTIVFF